MPNALNRAWMVGRGRRRVPGDGRWQDGGKFGLMTTWVSPRPCLARGTARGAKLAQFFDPELVADQFRGIALHLTQALFEDGGTGAGAGLTAQGTDGGALPRVQGRLLAELIELVHRLGAARLRGSGGWRHARRLLGRAFPRTTPLRRTIQGAGAQLTFPLLLVLGLALGLLAWLWRLALAGLGLRLGLTLPLVLGLTRLLTTSGLLILGLFPLFGLGLLLLIAATGLRRPLRGWFTRLLLARLILLGLFRLRPLTVLGLFLLGAGRHSLLLVRLATLGVLVG